ncbi:MAG TPA: RNA polymerase sigma factor, partial [Polyangiaceae bacterium]|nr:RNA polymerase sigma factor [Polyangiaceae bacterium]
MSTENELRPLAKAAAPARGIPAYGSHEIFALIYRQMWSLAGRRRDFDDLVQAAAEQALRSLPSFEGRSKISTWTYRVCYFTLLRHQRWYRRWLRHFTLTERGELPETHSGGAADAVFLEDKERSARLRAAVARLPPKHRAVVVLHDLEGVTIESIASILKAKPFTVRSRLRDGRKALAQLLADDL